MSESTPYIHRDISWLDFNYRVLQEAKDPSNPLFERIKFLAIYSSNLDEFFRVRVANHRNLERVGKRTKKRLDYNPKGLLKDIVQEVNQQQEEFSKTFSDQIIPELKQHGIHLLHHDELNEEQLQYIDDYFKDNLLPFVQPVLLVDNKIRPFLNNAALYLMVHLKSKKEKHSSSAYAIVKIPSDYIPRFIELPSIGHRRDLILLDDLVRHNITWLFPGYDIVASYSIKLTRDAELYIDDEHAGDLIQKIRESLTKRNVGPASRLVYDRDMPDEMLEFLMDVLELSNFDLLKEGRYHNNFDFFDFPDFGMHHLKNIPMPPLPYPKLEEANDIFEAIEREDHLIHVPYHSYESVIRFFEEAVHDPCVTHIKIVQYRVAQESRIMDALTEAVKHGKQVSVFIEVKARFDEEANLKWGEKLEQAGINVHYSLPGVKVHSKIALIRRFVDRQSKLYTYLSTGNFHEDTVKLYSDLGLFTADPRITREVARVFSFLETVQNPRKSFQHLLVGQFNLRSELEHLIEHEIKEAKAGRKAEMILKLNSLQDPKMVDLLYKASRAGVHIRMIIRGICSVVPGKDGLSEQIRAISIVDRFLEHARVYVFHHSGEELMYVSSADWMVRNLDHRVETAFPIYDPVIKQEIRDIIGIQLNDNVKARVIDEDRSNTYRKDTSDLAIRSQRETYYYFKRKLESHLTEHPEPPGDETED